MIESWPVVTIHYSSVVCCFSFQFITISRCHPSSFRITFYITSVDLFHLLFILTVLPIIWHPALRRGWRWHQLFVSWWLTGGRSRWSHTTTSLHRVHLSYVSTRIPYSSCCWLLLSLLLLLATVDFWWWHWLWKSLTCIRFIFFSFITAFLALRCSICHCRSNLLLLLLLISLVGLHNDLIQLHFLLLILLWL